MDKNTITGLVLIAILLVGFSFLSRPSQEQLAGMKCVGINPESDLVEIVEIPALKWFVGTQFHPEYSSTVLHPHPLFVAFVKAAIENENEKK